MLSSKYSDNNMVNSTDISNIESQISSLNSDKADWSNALEVIEDTVGWTGKNRLQVPASVVTTTKNNTTFTVVRNSSGEVEYVEVTTGTGGASANTLLNLWTANYHGLEEGSWIVSDGTTNSNTCMYVQGKKGSSGTVSNIANTDNADHEATFTVSYDIKDYFTVMLFVKNGAQLNAVKFYPMLRPAYITDSTYEPHHENVETMYEEEIHGVNLLEYDLASLKELNIVGTWTSSAYERNSVTFTHSSDNSISAVGTASANAGLILCNFTENSLPKGTYTIRGGTSASTAIYVSKRNSSGINLGMLAQQGANNGAPITFTVDYSDYVGVWVYLYITSGTVISTAVKFYPMLYKAELNTPTPPSYRPYNTNAIQNQIDRKADQTALAPVENGSTASQAYAVGEHFMRDGAFCTAKTAIASGGSFTLNTNYIVETIAGAIETLTSDLTAKTLAITPKTVTGLSYNYTSIVQYGKVVTVSLRIIGASGLVAGWATIFDSLPTAKSAQYINIVDDNGNAYTLYIDTSGDIQINFTSGFVGRNTYILINYIAA